MRADLAARAPALLAEARVRPATQDELLLDRPLAAVHPPSRPLARGPAAAARLLRRIDRFPGRYLAGLAEVVLVAAIGFQCTALLGVGITPLKPAPGPSERPAQLPSPVILSSYSAIFGKSDSGGVLALPAGGLELHGIRQDGRAGGGSAIISESDGPQRSFGVGEAISPGLVLKEVGPGYATVTRNGMDERLVFADFDAPSTGPRPAERNGPSPRPTPANPLPSPAWPPPSASAGPAAGRSSINFADPSTLPASLTAPAVAPPESRAKPGE